MSREPLCIESPLSRDCLGCGSRDNWRDLLHERKEGGGQEGAPGFDAVFSALLGSGVLILFFFRSLTNTGHLKPRSPNRGKVQLTRWRGRAARRVPQSWPTSGLPTSTRDGKGFRVWGLGFPLLGYQPQRGDEPKAEQFQERGKGFQGQLSAAPKSDFRTGGEARQT